MDAFAEPLTCRFNDFLLDRQSRALYRENIGGERTVVPIGSRAFEILCLLIDRHGEFVPRREIMAAIWPNAVVEESNLTVQMSALRRVLDNGRAQRSCIQTVPGRGYCFAVPVSRSQQSYGDPALAAPRLSIAVLPFQNLSGNSADDCVADAITDDLTTELTFISVVSATPREAAHVYRGQTLDVRGIGEELRVRYVLKGSVRRFESAVLRINVQLISSETAAVLWSDRFDQTVEEPALGQEQIVRRIRDELSANLIEIENARSLRERPTDPDAFDLVLRVCSIRLQPPSVLRNEQAVALLERVLLQDPSSVFAMTFIAYYLSDAAGRDGWSDFEKMQRAECLLAHARALAPESPLVLNTYVLWLRTLGRCDEVMDICQQAIQTYKNRIRIWLGLYHELAMCKTWMGQAEEGIALEMEANRLNPRSAWRYVRYRHIGWYSLLLGRDQDAIENLERSLTIKPEEDGSAHWQYRRLAAAYARAGNAAAAKQYLANAERLWPYDTVRSRAPELLTSTVYVQQFKRFQDALRLAGLRDHADENADFGVPVDVTLRGDLAGFTPVGTPGAITVRTPELAELLARVRPIVIDTMTYTWGLSIPGAIGLKYAGLGGSLTDQAQDRLHSKMRELTEGNSDAPIVAVGWNSERFDGRNLALRLAALGYRQIYWYRGGREAWEVAGQPEATLDVQQW
jgi:TolB-like protein